MSELVAPTIPAGREMCLHCLQRVASRPRGLCAACYYADGVRERYPTRLINQNPHIGRPCGENTTPEPTDAAPGSEAKILVLQQRLKQGQDLWHPLDNLQRVDAGKKEGRHDLLWEEEEDEAF